MKLEDLDILRCPHCAGHLEVFSGKPAKDELAEGILRCLLCSRRFPVSRSIPRFSTARNNTSYDISFAQYESIQLDSVNGSDIAGSRLKRLVPRVGSEDQSKVVLEVGCGSGRYTEHILGHNGDVWAVDISASALEACRRNLKRAPRLRLVQGDIYQLPFAADAFDIVYSLGILMAVRSPLEALKSLQRHLKPQGFLVTDIYLWRARHWLNPRTWIRPMTSRLPISWLWKGCVLLVPALWPLSRMLGRIPRLGQYFRFLIPVSNYDGILPLNEEGQKQFSLLDTFDALAAPYAHCVTERQFRMWLKTTGLSDIEIFPGGMMAARARKRIVACQSSVGKIAGRMGLRRRAETQTDLFLRRGQSSGFGIQFV